MEQTTVTESTDSQRREGVQVIARAAEMLRRLAAEPDGLTLIELAARVGLPRSTAHRIVGALSQEGFVRAAPSGKLRIGSSLIGIAVSSRRDLRHEAAPFIERLSHELRETVDLAVLDGSEVLFVDQYTSRRTLRVVAEIGARFPAVLHGQRQGGAGRPAAQRGRAPAAAAARADDGEHHHRPPCPPGGDRDGSRHRHRLRPRGAHRRRRRRRRRGEGLRRHGGGDQCHHPGRPLSRQLGPDRRSARCARATRSRLPFTAADQPASTGTVGRRRCRPRETSANRTREETAPWRHVRSGARTRSAACSI